MFRIDRLIVRKTLSRILTETIQSTKKNSAGFKNMTAFMETKRGAKKVKLTIDRRYRRH